MIVYDSGQFFWNWDVQVTGLDVDDAALEKARRGVYHHNSFRALTPGAARAALRQARAAGAQVKEPIRDAWCSFRAGQPGGARRATRACAPLDVDLLPQRAHLLLGRDDPASAVRLFHEALAPGGYLFLGHAESLSRITDLFTPIRFQGAMVYQKPDDAAVTAGASMIRVLVVDDSAFVRQALTRMLGAAPDIEVVGTAVDGKEGLEKARAAAARTW